MPNSTGANMTWDPTLKFGDLAIVLATIAGPILAVQAQKAVERWREREGRKLWVFQTLMSTRAARLSSDHVRALNMIDLVFYGTRRLWRNRRSAAEQNVLDKWKEYLDELSVPWDVNVNNDARAVRRLDMFTDLLVSIGADVGYRFDRVQLKKGAYSPVAHENQSTEQDQLRKLAIDVFSGKRNLKMDVNSIPATANVSIKADERSQIVTASSVMQVQSSGAQSE